jgi:predicted Zn-dependent peptidase
MPGPFAASASVFTAKTDSALIEFMSELRRIRDEPVPEEEVARARAYIALRLPSLFETTSGTSDQLVDLVVNELPLGWHADYVRAVNAVTAADVQRVARQHIDPERLDIVVVGDRELIQEGIRALDLGPLVLRDLWGAPLPLP